MICRLIFGLSDILVGRWPGLWICPTDAHLSTLVLPTQIADGTGSNQTSTSLTPLVKLAYPLNRLFANMSIRAELASQQTVVIVYITDVAPSPDCLE
jgi:hypothetical protein